MDTVRISRKAYPNYENHKLSTMIKNLEIEVKERHRANADAMAVVQIFFKCREVLLKKKRRYVKK